jgi:hypothetical protein
VHLVDFAIEIEIKTMMSLRGCIGTLYWPDDGLFRPKLVANNRNNKIKDSCVRRSTYFISF